MWAISLRLPLLAAGKRGWVGQACLGIPGTAGTQQGRLAAARQCLAADTGLAAHMPPALALQRSSP